MDFVIGIWEARAWKSGENDWRPKQKGCVAGIDACDLTDYTYRSLTKLFREFPYITGVQIRVNEESGIPKDRQTEFYRSTYFRAIGESDRPIILDYRGWGANSETTEDAIRMCPGMRLSVKYWAEFMGAPYQPAKIDPGYSCSDYLKQPLRYSFLWQVWSLGNLRLLLWGDTEYVRRFARSLSLGGGAGFEISAQLTQKGYGNAPGS